MLCLFPVLRVVIALLKLLIRLALALSILQLELNNARSRRVNPFTHPAGYVGDLSLSRGSFQLFPIPRVTPAFFSLNHGFLAEKTAGKLPRGHLFCTQQCVHYDSTTIRLRLDRATAGQRLLILLLLFCPPAQSRGRENYAKC